MHILFLSDNFPPEGNAPATRTYEHSREWVKLGHKVTVITCAPNFPDGKVYDGYKNKVYYKETMDGIDVIRVKTFIAANDGFFKRIVDYISFMFSGFIASLFVKKPDVVIATSPQFFTACAGWAVSVIKRRPFVFELRDIWPASITAVEAMEKNFVIKILEKLEMFLYKKADKIISVTNAFKKEISRRGIDEGKIDVVLNGVDLSLYSPRVKDAQLVDKFDLQGKFVAGYIGTHGLAHALETIVEAAEKLKSREDIVFLFAGGGAGADDVAKLVKEKGLHNVRILGRQEKALMPRVWSVCDLSVVHLKNTPLFESVIPSKIFESMGMGLPILIGLPKGEATSIVYDNKAGVVIPSEDPGAMAEAISMLADDMEVLGEYSANSYKASRQFDRKNAAEVMFKCIEQI